MLWLNYRTIKGLTDRSSWTELSRCSTRWTEASLWVAAGHVVSVSLRDQFRWLRHRKQHTVCAAATDNSVNHERNWSRSDTERNSKSLQDTSCPYHVVINSVDEVNGSSNRFNHVVINSVLCVLQRLKAIYVNGIIAGRCSTRSVLLPFMTTSWVPFTTWSKRLQRCD